MDNTPPKKSEKPTAPSKSAQEPLKTAPHSPKDDTKGSLPPLDEAKINEAIEDSSLMDDALLDDDMEDDDIDFGEEEISSNPEISDTSSTKTILEKTSISEIPIKIQLEMARFEVSLRELARMEVGYKLPIDVNPRIVHLTSSGKMIGKGEIIEVGDTIGVKILELYK